MTNKLINRFGVQTTEPIVEFFYARFDAKLGVKEYFERKRHLGNLAQLKEEEIIPMLIQGLHPKMIVHFTSVKPKTYSEFYRIALTAENDFKRFNESKLNATDTRTKPIAHNAKNIAPKNKPPSACRICEKIGLKNRFHWAQDCYNKNKPQNQNAQQTSVKTANVVENENGFNEINSINLN